MGKYSKSIIEFNENSLPDLDACVMGALELFAEKGLPKLKMGNYSRPLVVGSGNAAVTGKILFQGEDAVFADESIYDPKLNSIKGIDGAILISASGEKHAPKIAERLKNRGIETRLLTCNPDAREAKEFIKKDKIFVFPRQREPYTYNTSTYMGMILSKTKENPQKIMDFIHKSVFPLTLSKSFDNYDSYYFIVPERFDSIREMFSTKFDELFGAKISGRVFTFEQTKHAKTVIPYDKELFVSLGIKNNVFGKDILNLPLPKKANYGTIMAIGYYLIGQIQKQNPPWFKENIKEYCENASKEFGSKIKCIVE